MDAFIAAVMAQSQRVTSLSLTMSGELASDLSAFLTVSPSWWLGAGITGSIFQFGRNKCKLEIERKK